MALISKTDSGYDQADPKSIESFGKRLIEKTLRMVVGSMAIPDNTLNEKPGLRSKASFGFLVEKYYYGISPDNASGKPDFPEAGVELKTTPIKKLKNGLYSAKERLVLGLINYIEESKKDFYGSSFFTKNKKIMLISYLYNREVNVGDLPVKMAKLIDFDELPVEDRKIIREDWEKINHKIREGMAHELSEGDTFYLGACTKAEDSTIHRAQANGISAKPRAYSFKSGYMTELVRRELGEIAGEDRAVRDYELEERLSFEDIVINKLGIFIGKSVEEIHNIIGEGLNVDSKDYYAALARRMLGVKAARVAEFDAAEVSMKTLQLRDDGMPKEHMSFPAFKYAEIVNEKWDADEEGDEIPASFQRQVEKIFFFVIYQCDGDCKNDDRKRLKKVMFWSMPYEDRVEAKYVWSETVRLIKEDKIDYLPGSTENRIAHVRPHARDSDDVEIVSDKKYVKKSFWLNKEYLKDIIS